MTLEEHLAQSPELREWYEAFRESAKSIAGEGLPNLVPGWPDSEFDQLSHSIYLDHCTSLLNSAVDDTPDGEDVKLTIELPSFKEWKDKLKEGELKDRDNLGYSNFGCDLCGASRGDRHAVTALPENPADNPEFATYEVCGDCLAYIANGDLPHLD